MNNILSFAYSVLVRPFILNIVADKFAMFEGSHCNKQYSYSQERVINKMGDTVKCTPPLKLTLTGVRVLDVRADQVMPTIVLFFNDKASPYSREAKFSIDNNERAEGKKDTRWTMDTACSALGIKETNTRIALEIMDSMVNKISVFVRLDEPMDPSWNPSVTFVAKEKYEEKTLDDAIKQDNEWLGLDENGDKPIDDVADDSSLPEDDDVPF